MTRDEYITLAEKQASTPFEQWGWALSKRKTDPSQELADAEHYLWNRYYVNEGPVEAYRAFITPFGYYGLKKAGILDGRSEATLQQLGSGLLGAYNGLFK